MGIPKETLFRQLRRQLGYLPTGDGIGGLTVDHAYRIKVIEVDEAKSQVRLCIERHPSDLETGNPMVCWQFWTYDATRDALDFVEEVPPVTTDGLCATEEHGKAPRGDLSTEELKVIADAPYLPDWLWPLQLTTAEAAYVLGITARQTLRLRDWGHLKEVGRDFQGEFELCLFNAEEVEELRRQHADLREILHRRNARRLLEVQEQ
jgi:hypothetical protein